MDDDDDDDDDTNLANFLSGIVDHAEASPGGVRRWPRLVHAPSRPQPAPAGAPGGADPQRRQFAMDRGLPLAASWVYIGAFDDAERTWRKAAREEKSDSRKSTLDDCLEPLPTPSSCL